MNIFQMGIKVYKDSKQKSLSRKAFHLALLEAVKKGSLTDAKIKSLKTKGRNLNELIATNDY